MSKAYIQDIKNIVSVQNVDESQSPTRNTKQLVSNSAMKSNAKDSGKRLESENGGNILEAGVDLVELMNQNPLIIRKRAGILKQRHQSVVPMYKQKAEERSLHYSPSIHKHSLQDKVYGTLPRDTKSKTSAHQS